MFGRVRENWVCNISKQEKRKKKWGYSSGHGEAQFKTKEEKSNKIFKKIKIKMGHLCVNSSNESLSFQDTQTFFDSYFVSKILKELTLNSA